MKTDHKETVRAASDKYPSLESLLEANPDLCFGEVFDYLEVIHEFIQQEQNKRRYEHIDLYSNPFRLTVAALLIQDKPLDFPLLRQAVAHHLINQSKEQVKRFTKKSIRGEYERKSNLEQLMRFTHFLKEEGCKFRQISALFQQKGWSEMKTESLRKKFRKFRKDNPQIIANWSIDNGLLSDLVNDCKMIEKSFQLQGKYGIKQTLVIPRKTFGPFLSLTDNSKEIAIKVKNSVNSKKLSGNPK